MVSTLVRQLANRFLSFFVGGFYCDRLNDTAVTGPCDAGYYCRSGSDTATPTYGISKGDAGICPAGYFCAEQTAEPEPCPAGTFNNVTGNHC